MLKVAVFISWMFLSLCVSQSEGGFIQQDAHEHGAAILNIAQDADIIFVEFISPSINIVGFEYQPSTDAEKALVETAVLDLSNGLSLFAPNSAANCELINAEVESEIATTEHDHEEHNHDETEHKDEDHDHDETEHKDEDHDHDETEHKDGEHSEDEEHKHDEDAHMHDELESHSEFHASYEFNCNNPNQLSSFDLTALFNNYPGIQDLDVQYALDNGQGAAELSPDDTQLDF